MKYFDLSRNITVEKLNSWTPADILNTFGNGTTAHSMTIEGRNFNNVRRLYTMINTYSVEARDKFLELQKKSNHVFFYYGSVPYYAGLRPTDMIVKEEVKVDEKKTPTRKFFAIDLSESDDIDFEDQPMFSTAAEAIQNAKKQLADLNAEGSIEVGDGNKITVFGSIAEVELEKIEVNTKVNSLVADDVLTTDEKEEIKTEAVDARKVTGNGLDTQPTNHYADSSW